MVEIKPCPVCGGKAKVRSVMPLNYVLCSKCRLVGPVVTDRQEQCDGRDKAVQLWNAGFDVVFT